MRPNHLNIDSTEEHRIKRIRCISQGFVLKKFRDPKVPIEKKYELAEKIYLANIKTDKENGIAVADTKIIVIRDNQKPVIIEQKQEVSSGRRISINP